MRRWTGRKKWWLRRGSQIRTGAGRLDAALERVEALSDDVCQVLILGLPEGPLLAGVEVYGKRMRICGRAGRVTVAPAVLWDLVEAMRKTEKIYVDNQFQLSDNAHDEKKASQPGRPPPDNPI